jgi:hypothetical protein
LPAYTAVSVTAVVTSQPHVDSVQDERPMGSRPHALLARYRRHAGRDPAAILRGGPENVDLCVSVKIPLSYWCLAQSGSIGAQKEIRMRKIITTALAGFTAVAMLTACTSSALSGSDGAAGTTNLLTTEIDPTDAPVVTHAPPKPKYTVAQQNAIRTAKSYLQLSGFSRAGLIEQLSSTAGSGFRRKDAVFAVNHIKVNWNYQAVRAAKAYLELSGFSRAGLIEQLSSSAGGQFTLAQATYAVNHVGLR